ncbi:MAG: phosphoenolpyruvate carboxylase [Alphaproteobacteria bacterium]
MATAQTLDPANLHATYRDRLATHAKRAARDPQSNPVRLLAFDISHDVETGEIAVDDIARLAKHLCDNALIDRATRLRAYLAYPTAAAALEAFEAQVRTRALGPGNAPIPFDQFAAQWSRARYGLVLTAHPTFAMSGAMRQVLADLASGNQATRQDAAKRLKDLAHAPDDIDLAQEHVATQAAIANLQVALGDMHRAVLRVAREFYPEQWTSLTPRIATLASWVGYDIDGRVDIGWGDSIRFRLHEKATQLNLLAATAGAITPEEPSTRLDALKARLAAAAQIAGQENEAFSRDLEAGSNIVDAANLLTSDNTDRLLSANEIGGWIDNALAQATTERTREDLVLLKTQVLGQGLGTAHIHLRVNAVQLHNAVYEHFDLFDNRSFDGRVALARLTELIDEAVPETVNFGSLERERTTAKRQFMLVAQILKHIDADTPIRFLIAECESPFTVLAALYFAKLFGVESQVDISPLFETSDALERGGRLLEQLLDNPAYLAYIKARGRLAIQTGFSDAGRFFGQIPAGLAIERLQILLARHLKTRGITDIEVVIFNTHGESVGRGANPVSLRARQHYVFTPWARVTFRHANVPVCHETSFQGGDGFVALATPSRARITLVGLIEAERDVPDMARDDDLFYKDIAFTWDFYRELRAYQNDLFHDPDYRAVLGAFGTNLLHTTGSRRARRSAKPLPPGTTENLSRMRAIPHNAILQQLGYSANVIAGIGLIARHEVDRFMELVRTSPRAGALMQMVAFARRQSSLTALAAYGCVFDAGFWVARADNRARSTTKTPGGATPCLVLAKLVGSNQRFAAFARLHNRLRTDAMFLRDVLDALDLDGGQSSDDPRAERYLLHALRIGLIMHLFLLAARLPNFSTRNDMSLTGVHELVLTMRVPEALDILRAVFPMTGPDDAAGDFAETATYQTGRGRGYPQVHQTYIEPMERIYQVLKDIGVGLSHHFGAYG